MFVTKEDEAANIDPQTLEDARRRADIERLVSKVAPKPLDPPKPIGERFGEVLDWMLTKQEQPKTLLDLGDKLTSAVTEVGRRDGEPVYFDPTMMHAMGSLKNAGRTSEAISKLGQKDKLGFVSKAETVVRDKMGGRASADEIKAMLQSAGVKTEELEDRGFFKWLEEKSDELFGAAKKKAQASADPVEAELKIGTPKISKEDVAQELTGPKRPTIISKQYGGTKETNEIKRIRKQQQEIQKQNEEFEDYLKLYHTPEYVEAVRKELLQDSKEYTEQVTINKIAKEIEQKRTDAGLDPTFLEIRNLVSQYSNRLKNEVSLEMQLMRLENPPPLYESHSLRNLGIGENYREKVFSEINSATDYRIKGDWPTHFYAKPGGKRPIFHIRMQDVTDTEGRKLLNMDELQSDVHQQGREQGYNKKSQQRLSEAEMRKIFAIMEESPDYLIMQQAHKPGMTDLNEMVRIAAKYLDDDTYKKLSPYLQKYGPIADAPMKKNWVRAGVKNLIQTAIDEGKDGISWTPGKMQAERAGQGMQEVGRLKYTDAQNLIVYDRKGVLLKSIKIPQQELSSYVGGEIAKQLKNQRSENIRIKNELEQKVKDSFERLFEAYMGGEARQGLNLREGAEPLQKKIRLLEDLEDNFSRTGSLSHREAYRKRLQERGVPTKTIEDYEIAMLNRDLNLVGKKPASVSGDLKFGGQGMETFYDTMVKNEVESIAKKYGLKVQKTKVQAKDGKEIELWTLPFNDKIRKEISEKGQPLYQTIPAAVGLGELIRQYKQQEQEQEP